MRVSLRRAFPLVPSARGTVFTSFWLEEKPLCPVGAETGPSQQKPSGRPGEQCQVPLGAAQPRATARCRILLTTSQDPHPSGGLAATISWVLALVLKEFDFYKPNWSLLNYVQMCMAVRGWEGNSSSSEQPRVTQVGPLLLLLIARKKASANSIVTRVWQSCIRFVPWKSKWKELLLLSVPTAQNIWAWIRQADSIGNNVFKNKMHLFSPPLMRLFSALLLYCCKK